MVAVLAPQCDEALYEVVRGVRVEKKPTAMLSTVIAGEIYGHLWTYGRTKKVRGRFLGEGMFILDDTDGIETKRRPDVAFVSAERLPLVESLSPEGDFPCPPDLAVEIVSRNDNAQELDAKIDEYFRFGVRQVWVVLGVTKKVLVYDGPTTVRGFGKDDMLTTPLLPGFEVRTGEFFPGT